MAFWIAPLEVSLWKVLSRRPIFAKACFQRNEVHAKDLSLFAGCIPPSAPPPAALRSEVDMEKMNVQLIANEENQDRAERGKNEAGGMISSVCRSRKHVGDAAADIDPIMPSTIVGDFILPSPSALEYTPSLSLSPSK
jgi:hypothetical protein